MQRRTILGLGAAALLPPALMTAPALMTPAFAHHGWSSFDQDRPIYLEGTLRKVTWANPHVELELELATDLRLPADLAQRALPSQSAAVDGKRLLGATSVPTRRDKLWNVELAPLTRMEAWKVPELKAGEKISVIGFTFAAEKGDAVLRAEYLFAGGQAYGLRSSPA